MQIRNAKLQDIVGHAARQSGFTIVAAQLELDGAMFEPSFHLNELATERIPSVLRVPLEQNFDVAWVRARLPVVFGLTPDPAEAEKTFLSQGFVAVPEGSDEGVAFECSDYYGSTSLTFSDAETDESLKARAADAFWALLLSEPEALADFAGRIYHDGAGVWLNYGCEAGEPFCFESVGEE